MNRSKEDVKFFKVKELSNKGKELFNKVRMLLKKSVISWKYKECSFVINFFVKFLVLDGVGFFINYDNFLCYFCIRVYDLDDCELFSKKILEFERIFARKEYVFCMLRNELFFKELFK